MGLCHDTPATTQIGKQFEAGQKGELSKTIDLLVRTLKATGIMTEKGAEVVRGYNCASGDILGGLMLLTQEAGRVDKITLKQDLEKLFAPNAVGDFQPSIEFDKLRPLLKKHLGDNYEKIKLKVLDPTSIMYANLPKRPSTTNT
jgi:hypothetical protein